MRIISALIGLCVLPSALLAQDAWGDEGGCARVAGEAPTTDMVFVLWPGRIERWESDCRIVDFEGDLNTRATIYTECSGEGETWEQVYGISLTEGETYAIWPADAPDFITELRRCE